MIPGRRTSSGHLRRQSWGHLVPQAVPCAPCQHATLQVPAVQMPASPPNPQPGAGTAAGGGLPLLQHRVLGTSDCVLAFRSTHAWVIWSFHAVVWLWSCHAMGAMQATFMRGRGPCRPSRICHDDPHNYQTEGCGQLNELGAIELPHQTGCILFTRGCGGERVALLGRSVG